MRRTGVLKRFVEETWSSHVEVQEERLRAISVGRIMTLLMLLAGGTGVAVTCLILEVSERKLRSWFQSSYQT
jgi:hypothetical protein